MKTYKSHKTVEAIRIKEVVRGAGDQSVITRLELEDGTSYYPPVGMFARYTPGAGDYLVKYRDGYHSISPASEFEDGYTEQQDTAATALAPTPSLKDTIQNPFRPVYRKLTEEEAQRVDAIKDIAHTLHCMITLVPKGRHQSLAFTALEEAVMWAVKAQTA